MIDIDELSVGHPTHLAVLAGHPGVIETDITFDAAPNDRDLNVQRVFTLLPAAPAIRPRLGRDDKPRRSRRHRPRPPRRTPASHRAGIRRGNTATDTEHPDIQIVSLGQPHPHRPHERVPLLSGMLPNHLGQLVTKRSRIRSEPGEVAGGKLDRELVRDEHPVRAAGAPVIGLTSQRACDLDRLDTALEDLGERALDEAAQATLKAL